MPRYSNGWSFICHHHLIWQPTSHIAYLLISPHVAMSENADMGDWVDRFKFKFLNFFYSFLQRRLNQSEWERGCELYESAAAAVWWSDGHQHSLSVVIWLVKWGAREVNLRKECFHLSVQLTLVTSTQTNAWLGSELVTSTKSSYMTHGHSHPAWQGSCQACLESTCAALMMFHANLL